MRIGIDFDNTIACYEGVFYQAAIEKGLIPPHIHSTKSAVRDYLRAVGKEPDWTELQGYVYGARMDLARPYPGVEEFFDRCRKLQIPLFIISHKTKTPYLGPPYDLHESARRWLLDQPFDSPPAYFELTLAEKLARIEALQCTLFIDDLPELLLEPAFPTGVKKILFDPHQTYADHPSYFHAASWRELSQFIGAHD